MSDDPARGLNPQNGSALVEREIIASGAWFIRIRWLAGLGVLVATWVVTTVLAVRMPTLPIYTVGAVILVYNAIFWWARQRLLRNQPGHVVSFGRMTNWQIGLDYLAMATLIHYTGGVESPVVLYFIFHIILAAILLSPQTTFLCATFAAFLLGAIVGLEYAGLATHVHVSEFIGVELYRNHTYIVGNLFFFISTLYTTAYLASALNSRLRERAGEVIELSQELKQADQQKSKFVLTVTHELRSPVSGIRSLLRTITGGYAGSFTEQQSEIVERALRRADFLQTLIDDLLDLAAGKTALDSRQERTAAALDRCIDRVIKLFEAPAREKQIRIEFRCEDASQSYPVLASNEDLDRIFGNLVSNAIKYTPAGGQVQVSLKRSEREALVQVSDTGIGIPQDCLPHLFKEFYRAPNAKAVQKEGTGLGLAIAKDVVARYQGRITVDSRLGQGTAFTVTLPLA